MNIQLSEHFTYKKILRFTFPSIVMMVFTSIYGVVDGIFVSNFVGKTPFAAINLIMPFIMIFGTIGFMIGTGGSALVAKTFGEGNEKKANNLFSMLIYITIGLGILFSIVGIIFIRPVSIMLGAEGAMIEDCVTYGTILLVSLTAFILQNAFQSFLVTAEKPNLGLVITVAAGLTNIVLDALFIAIFKWGLVGAAIATAISQCVGGLAALIYFALPNRSRLRLGKSTFDGKAFLKTCTNGSSELMTNLSMSLVNMLYNFQLMRFAGENGVSAYGVIMYINFIFISIFTGYSIGIAPVIGYHYGAGNSDELKNMRKKGLFLIGCFSLILTALAEVLALPLAKLFVSYDSDLLAMTQRAFMLYSISFLFCGFNVFGSAFFTALNNGLVSALISFMRALVFQVGAVMILPIFLQLDGIWFAIVVAEFISLMLTAFFFVKMKTKYQYC
ncbi:MATE family efflux transporter [Anaerosporobacter sp.]